MRSKRGVIALMVVLCMTAPMVAGIHRQQSTRPGNQPQDKSDERPAERQATGPARLRMAGADRVKLESKLVSVTVTVSDLDGKAINGLAKDNFEIFDDGVKQDIALFTDDDAPISLGIIFDVSGSMGPIIKRSITALKSLFETCHDDDEFFEVAFSTRAQLVQDYTPSSSEILNRVLQADPKGATSLYDAVYLGIEKARQGHRARKAVLIISDGEENNSRYSGGELGRLIKESDVQVYAIGISDTYVGAGTLKHLAGMSGGRAFFPSEDQLVDIYSRISLMLRHQYLIGFYPTGGEATPRRHKLRLKLNAPKGLGRLTLSYKDGYQSFQ
jgi:Ca-activated chloride channel family protein